MLSLQRERNGEFCFSRLHSKGNTLLLLHGGCPYLTQPIICAKPGHGQGNMFTMSPQIRIIAGQTQQSVIGHAVANLQLGLQDTLPGTQIFHVHGADIGNNANVRLGDMGQIGNLAKVAHAHLQHRNLGIFLHGQQRHGKTQIVIEIGRGFADDIVPFQHCGNHFLGGAFSHGSGHAHHFHADMLTQSGGDLTQSDAGIFHHDSGISGIGTGS